MTKFLDYLAIAILILGGLFLGACLGLVVIYATTKAPVVLIPIVGIPLLLWAFARLLDNHD